MELKPKEGRRHVLQFPGPPLARIWHASTLTAASSFSGELHTSSHHYRITPLTTTDPDPAPPSPDPRLWSLPWPQKVLVVDSSHP
ncbi:hypothetical protein E3N88_18041 [Mikania micrantha]|uniref:Uncharacterized protein n=1 Tax=Mikania micrantha TaxID=192012 RepID=A0A5N6NVS7_9ASTR|nr:hypothetical protein E3N88_18041 [Mikania micrantha]